jgi:hypothetical protein
MDLDARGLTHQTWWVDWVVQWFSNEKSTYAAPRTPTVKRVECVGAQRRCEKLAMDLEARRPTLHTWGVGWVVQWYSDEESTYAAPRTTTVKWVE